MNPKETRLSVRPTRDEIARNAYLIYVQQGRPQGRDVQHWLEAEAQMTERRSDDVGHGDFHEDQNVDNTSTGNSERIVLL